MTQSDCVLSDGFNRLFADAKPTGTTFGIFWDHLVFHAHVRAEFVKQSVDATMATMATMTDTPCVTHITIMTGPVRRDDKSWNHTPDGGGTLRGVRSHGPAAVSAASMTLFSRLGLSNATSGAGNPGRDFAARCMCAATMGCSTAIAASNSSSESTLIA
jgi:hypothetical protein